MSKSTTVVVALIFNGFMGKTQNETRLNTHHFVLNNTFGRWQVIFKHMFG